MLIHNIIKFCSNFKLLIIVVAVTKSFPFNPSLQWAQLPLYWNCRRALTKFAFPPAAALVLFLNSLSEVVG